MSDTLSQRLQALTAAGGAALLAENRIGLETESLRVNVEGGISQQPHPRGLGSPLTNPFITTDYSEALLELITPPCASTGEALGLLRETQCFVRRHLENSELLWATSMPCVIAGESNIPLARYGNSNAGQMKTIYRRGLGHRYGRVMQVIAGVHFNYSFGEPFWRWLQAEEGASGQPLQDYISQRYFGLLRNLQRVGWLIPYLFGASPAVCKSFLAGAPGSNLEEFDEGTYYGPYATSLRMGDIGYQNNKENEVGVKACYDSLEEYIDTLQYAIETPYPGYQKIGVKVDGEYRQLNANILQIENEYYSTVRPKQLLEGYEKPILALQRRGVRYVELRSLDLNAFEPLGVAEEQLKFIEALMLYCLLEQSPRISPQERAEIDRNEMLTAHEGRRPGLELSRGGEVVTLRDWGLAIVEAMEPVCRLLDGDEPGGVYSRALAAQRQVVEEPALTPSARMLAEMRERGEGFLAHAQRLAMEHDDYFSALGCDGEQQRRLLEEAEHSLVAQHEIEAGDSQSFEEFLAAYQAQR